MYCVGSSSKIDAVRSKPNILGFEHCTHIDLKNWMPDTNTQLNGETDKNPHDLGQLVGVIVRAHPSAT